MLVVLALLAHCAVTVTDPLTGKGLYVEVLARWDLPSATYVEQSCMTMQLPLSAFLIIRSLSLPSSCRALASFLERFSLGFLLSASSATTFKSY